MPLAQEQCILGLWLQWTLVGNCMLEGGSCWKYLKHHGYTIRDAILTCARKPTWVSLIYRMEPTTKKCKTEKLKSKKRICSEVTVNSLGNPCSQSWRKNPHSSSLVTLDRPSTSLRITDRSFQYASPRLWNQLPASLRQPRTNLSNSASPSSSSGTSSISSIDSPLSSSITPLLFHSRLKTFLFCKSFPPKPTFFFSWTDSTDNPDCLPILLVFLFLHCSCFMLKINLIHVGFWSCQYNIFFHIV